MASIWKMRMGYYEKTENTHTRASGPVPRIVLPRVDGLYVSGLRYYKPEYGRWLSRDPVGEFAGENIYVFVFNNSLRWLDLLGLSCCNGGAPVDCNKLKYNMNLLNAQMNRISAKLKREGNGDDISHGSKLDMASDVASYLGLVQTITEEGLKAGGIVNSKVGLVGQLINSLSVMVDSSRSGLRAGNAFAGQGSLKNALDPLLDMLLTIVSAAGNATPQGKVIAAVGGVSISTTAKAADAASEYSNDYSDLMYALEQAVIFATAQNQYLNLEGLYWDCCR